MAKYRPIPCRMCGHPEAFLSGAWCRAQRLAAGLTLAALAARSGVHLATLCDVEHEKLRCTPRMRAAYEALSARKTEAA